MFQRATRRYNGNWVRIESNNKKKEKRGWKIVIRIANIYLLDMKYRNNRKKCRRALEVVDRIGIVHSWMRILQSCALRIISRVQALVIFKSNLDLLNICNWVSLQMIRTSHLIHEGISNCCLLNACTSDKFCVNAYFFFSAYQHPMKIYCY